MRRLLLVDRMFIVYYSRGFLQVKVQDDVIQSELEDTGSMAFSNEEMHANVHPERPSFSFCTSLSNLTLIECQWL